MKSYNDLNTENQNSETLDIHKLSTINILKKINDEDSKISTIVRESINEIKETTELAINSVKCGGRIFYIGAGTSCLLYTSPSPRDGLLSRMPSSA